MPATRHAALPLAAAVFAAALVQLTAAAPAAAQIDVPERWRTFASGNEVQAVAVDPADDGRVWVGTEGGGVVIWDLAYGSGTAQGDFVQVVAPAEPGLRSNTINDIAFDAATGDVWLATDYGVTHVAGGRWSTEVDEPGMPSSTVFSSVAVQDDGTVWAGTPDKGLARRSPAGVWDEVPADVFLDDDDEPREGPGSDRIAEMAFDADGRLWVVHGRGGSSDRPAISRYDPADGAWYHIAEGGPTGDPTERPMTGQILDVAVDEVTGEVWIATWSRGVARFDPVAETWTQWREQDPDSRQPTGLCGDETWAIAAEGGVAWVACGGQQNGTGVSRFDGLEWTDLGTDGALGQPITSIALAGDWAFLGTDSRKNATSFAGQGVLPATNVGSGLPTIAAPLVTDGPLPQANEISAIAFDDGGYAWVGTNGSGLLSWIPDENRWQQQRWDPAVAGLPGDVVTDLMVVGTELWVSATSMVLSNSRYVDGGVGVMDLATGRWRSVPRPEPYGEPYGNVSSLAQLPDGRIAMGLGSGTGGVGRDPQLGRGVAFYDPASQTYAYDTFAVTGGALNGDTVLDLATDGTDLWAAVSYFTDPDNNLRRTGGGAARYDGREWVGWGNGDAGFTAYADGLITGDTRALHVDGQGDVWAGTWNLLDGQLTSIWPYVDAVVNEWDGAAWRASDFEGQGWVSAIVEDTTGAIWAGTTRGHRQEYWPADGPRGWTSEDADAAEGGLRVFDGASWTTHSPEQGGFPVRGVTVLAIEPATGYVWVGTESGGILVYQEGLPLGPTRTPGPTRTAGPSPTPGPTNTPRPTDVPAVVTVAPTAAGPIGPAQPTATRDAGRDDEPEPPSEVPEASTWLLLALGMAAVGGWWAWQRRHAVGGA